MARARALLLAVLLVAPLALSFCASAQTLEMSEPVVMLAAAVGETADGQFVGSTATITITSAVNGSGHVFLDTFPLTAVDMQGSARLASRVATQLTGRDLHAYDMFFVVRSSAEQIGGPSAGAAMTVGAIAALNGWKVRDDVLITGTISPDATVGPVGGIAEKAIAAANVGITRFLFPAGQETVPLGDRFVELPTYCASELRIECVPVADVVEATNLMTDHVFERPPVTGNVTGEDFLARLGPLSDELVREAAERFDEATAGLAGAPESAAKTALAERLEGARVLLDRARNATANGTYYTAASTSFQSSIESRYVREASEYLASTERALAHAASLAEARDAVDRASVSVRGSPVRDTNSYEAVGAAQVRLLEAEQRLAAAVALAGNASTPQDLFDALHEAAYAAERAQTAEWWLLLADGFPEGEPVEAAALEEVARDTITTSKEEVAYVEAVFSSAGAPATLTASRDLLAKAESAMDRGFFAGAMLAALEASVRASVLLEIAGYGGNVPESKFEVAREGAARAIQGARSRGVESLLAQSAYEFGISLEDPQEKLSFLGLARVSGNLAGLPGLFDEARAMESRFQGAPFTYRVDVLYVAAAFAVGLALGAGAGLAALMPKKDEDDLPPERPEA